MTSMESISASEFKARCLEILDHVPPEGIAITKRGKRVANLYPERSEDALRYLGTIKELHVTGDILSTGLAWDANQGTPPPSGGKGRKRVAKG